MRKLGLFFVLLFTPLLANAQFTSVTATITDSDSQTWNNGKWTATLINPSPQNPPSINGTLLTPSQMNLSGFMDGSGIITASMASNAAVQPAGTYWTFTICPNASSQCSTVNATTAGATQNLSSTLSAGVTVVRFPASPLSYGYSDNEVRPTPNPGGIYYNVTSVCQRIWSGATWSCNGGAGSGFITGLTTLGTSGAATANLGILNIPIYASGCGAGCVNTINSVSGAFTFNGNMVVCSTTTCTWNNPSGISLESLGCAQDGSFDTRTGTDAASCINTALAFATPTNRVVLIQDKVSAISSIIGPAMGNWEIDGQGGGWSSVGITNCTISSNVVTFITQTQTQPLQVGEHVTVGGFTTCTALNNQRLTIATVPDSTHFTAAFTTANVASTAETGSANYLTGTGFVHLSANVATVDGITTTGNTCTSFSLQQAGANVTLKNFVFDGNSDNTTAAPATFCNSIRLFNMNNITIDGLVLYSPNSFNVGIANANGVTVTNTKIIDMFPGFNLAGAVYKDGLHFNGNVQNVNVSNIYGRTDDDLLAINANEALAGPSSNFNFVNVTSEQSNSILRIDTGSSGTSPVSHVHLANVNGSTYRRIGYLGDLNQSVGTSQDIIDVTWSNSTITSPDAFDAVDSIHDFSLSNVKWIVDTVSGQTSSNIGTVFQLPNHAVYALQISLVNFTEEYHIGGHTWSGLSRGSGVSSGFIVDTVYIDGLRITCGNVGACSFPVPSFISTGASALALTNLITGTIDPTNITQYYVPGSASFVQAAFSPNYSAHNLVAVTSANSDAVTYAFSAPGVNSFSLASWSTGNGGGLPGVLGLYDGTTSHMVWSTCSADDLFGYSPLTNVCTGTSAAWSILHTGAASFTSLSLNSGTNVVYRCATAGALPAGALTITAASCGSTVDTLLRVP